MGDKLAGEVGVGPGGAGQNRAQGLPLRWALAHLPAFLLVLTAILQMYLANFAELTPWKGGGFGMFSTLDDPEARFLRCYVQVGKEEYAVDPSPVYARAMVQLRAMPDPEGLRRLANHLLRSRWVDRGEAVGLGSRFRLGQGEPERAVAVSKARVELWRYQVDLTDGTIRAHPAWVVEASPASQPSDARTDDPRGRP